MSTQDAGVPNRLLTTYSPQAKASLSVATSSNMGAPYFNISASTTRSGSSPVATAASDQGGSRNTTATTSVSATVGSPSTTSPSRPPPRRPNPPPSPPYPPGAAAPSVAPAFVDWSTVPEHKPGKQLTVTLTPYDIYSNPMVLPGSQWPPELVPLPDVSFCFYRTPLGELAQLPPAERSAAFVVPPACSCAKYRLHLITCHVPRAWLPASALSHWDSVLASKQAGTGLGADPAGGTWHHHSI